MSDNAIRNVTDVCVDVTGLLDRLADTSGRVETVHVIGSDYLTISYDGEVVGRASDLPRLLKERDLAVHRIDVYDEFEATLPEE